MIILRQLASTTFNYIPKRFYIKPKKLGGKMTRQVHEELMRYISPNANIEINTDVLLRVQASDVHQYPDGNAFIAQILGGITRHCAAKLSVNVSDDEKNVEVTVKKIDPHTDFICRLAVPIRANLSIKSNDEVQVRNIFGEELCIEARKGIRTEEVRATNIILNSEEGNIISKRLLLGKRTEISTKNGKIDLDKLQGDRITCLTHSGDISTNCCYVEKSTFETTTGSLQLKNVHKQSSVVVHDKGAINMSGVHGNIHVQTNGGSLNLQLSELMDENIVTANNVDEAAINISDEVENTTDIDINSPSIKLDSSLAHLTEHVDEANKSFHLSKVTGNVNKLKICTNGSVTLGKLSWAESLQSAFNSNTI